MAWEKMLRTFITFFIIASIVGVVVSFLWNLVFHQSYAVYWATSISLATILGLIMAIYEAKQK